MGAAGGCAHLNFDALDLETRRLGLVDPRSCLVAIDDSRDAMLEMVACATQRPPPPTAASRILRRWTGPLKKDRHESNSAEVGRPACSCPRTRFHRRCSRRRFAEIIRRVR